MSVSLGEKAKQNKQKNKVNYLLACFGQAYNTTYYTSRVYAETTWTNLMVSSDVEAALEAPGWLE